VAGEGLDPGLIGGYPGPAAVLDDGHQRHERAGVVRSSAATSQNRAGRTAGRASATELFADSLRVTELGGPMSQAAAVAREFGFPCVVDAHGATRSLPSGALVEVDGTTGEIHVLELAPEENPPLPASDRSR